MDSKQCKGCGTVIEKNKEYCTACSQFLKFFRIGTNTSQKIQKSRKRGHKHFWRWFSNYSHAFFIGIIAGLIAVIGVDVKNSCTNLNRMGCLSTYLYYLLFILLIFIFFGAILWFLYEKPFNR